jgi:hypothetical protein
MLSPAPLPERIVRNRDEFEALTRVAATPFVMRGVVCHWPLVAAASHSAAELGSYLHGFHNGTPVSLMTGPPAIEGRLFYMEGFQRLNFLAREAAFADALRAILGADAVQPAPTIYMGSASESRHWPGLARANPLPLLVDSVIPNLWMGTRAVVGPHNDHPDNIACVVAGRRRFRLFPPEEFANLYVGPMELNPAGRPVSFVSVTQPDLARYPRYARALEASRDAVLVPGDAIYIPSMWWHSVESLAPFNLLVNYWWETPGSNPSHAEAALIHALLAMGPLDRRQRRAWKAVFDHLAFRADDAAVEHIPPQARGWLGNPTPDLRDKMRNQIRRSLLDA